MRDWILPGKTLTMELSSYCQARCMMCPFEEFPYKNRNMSFNLFKKCVDEGSKHGLENIDVCLMGDSLLDSGFCEKIQYVRDKYPYMKIYASSQGMSIDDEVVCKYVDTLHVSFYGTTKETYELVHGGGVRFEKALNNIEQVLSRPKDERPYVVLTFLMVPPNADQLNDWLEKWEPLADEVIAWKPHNWGGYYNTKRPSKNELYIAKSCGRPMNGPFCIWVNGDVTPCCFSWDERMVIGNVNNDSLEQIYFGEKRNRIKNIHEKRGFFGCNLPCEKCDQIFSRNDALVYTNHGRNVGGAIYGKDIEVRFREENE